MAGASAKRIPRFLCWIGIPAIFIVLVAVFWQWDWFIPIVEAKASAAIGRKVTIGSLHMQLGRVVAVIASDVTIANPSGWAAGDPPLARVGRLTVQVDAWRYVQGHGLVIPLIVLDQPHLYAA